MARDVDVGLERWLGCQLDGALGDVRGEVADALEVGDDLEGGGDEAQVARRGLAQGEQLEREVVDLDVEPVDRVVALDRDARERAIALGEAAHRLGDLILDEPAHLQQARAELAELALVGSIGVQRHQPNRPVT